MLYKNKYSYSERTNKALNEGATKVVEQSQKASLEIQIRMLQRKLQTGCVEALRPGYELKLQRLQSELKAI